MIEKLLLGSVVILTVVIVAVDDRECLLKKNGRKWEKTLRKHDLCLEQGFFDTHHIIVTNIVILFQFAMTFCLLQQIPFFHSPNHFPRSTDFGLKQFHNQLKKKPMSTLALI